jgi:HEAT repeat protein
MTGLTVLVLAGCKPRASTNVAPGAPVPTNRTTRTHATFKSPAPSRTGQTFRLAKDLPTATGNVQASPATGVVAKVSTTPPPPRSVLAAMSAIRRATTVADRRRAIAAFVANAAELAKNPASVEMLLDALKIAPEHDVMMAVQQVLGQAPDTAVPFMAALLYQDAKTSAERERLLGVIRQTQTPNAVSMLTGLADDAGGRYSEPLALAAVDTLGVIGTPAAIRDLIGRFETAAAQGQSVQPLIEALSRTVNPAAFELLAATARPESGATTQVRLAALNALGNYPTAASRDALTRFVAIESDPALLAAARQALKRANLDLPDDFGKAPEP